MKKQILLFVLFFSIEFVHGQVPSWQWANRAGFLDGDVASDVVVDQSSFVYTVGYFGDSIRFDTILLVGNGIYIVKQNNAGNTIWAKKVTQTPFGYVDVFDISLDIFGHIYITGRFNQSVTFGSTTLTSFSSNNDFFVAKYDSSGNAVWAVSGGYYGNEYGMRVVADNNGNVYVSGLWTTFGMLQIGSYQFVQGLNDDDKIFLLKYDSLGNLAWVQSWGLNFYQPMELSIDSAGFLYLAGNYSGGNITFGSYTLYGGHGAYLVKYDGSGNTIWAQRIYAYTGGTEVINQTFVDTGGFIYFCGNMSGLNVTFGNIIVNPTPGATNAFLAKYDSSGNAIWVRSSQNANFAYGESVFSRFGNNVCVVGHFLSNIIYFGSQNLLNLGVTDLFVVNYDTSGNVLWAKGGGGADIFLPSSSALPITQRWEKAAGTLTTGEIYITGSFLVPSISFDAINVFNYDTSGSEPDVFLAKLFALPTNKQDKLPILNELIIYPSPFTETTKLFYSLQKPSTVTVEVYNIVGKKVLTVVDNIKQDSGNYSYEFTLKDPGTYLIRLKTASNSSIKKMVKL